MLFKTETETVQIYLFKYRKKISIKKTLLVLVHIFLFIFDWFLYVCVFFSSYFSFNNFCLNIFRVFTFFSVHIEYILWFYSPLIYAK